MKTDKNCPGGMRCMGEWSNEEVLQMLKHEGRTDAAQVYGKFLKVGYKGLEGGNVSIIGEPASEYARVVSICSEFGFLTPDLNYLTREQWDVFKPEKGDVREAFKELDKLPLQASKLIEPVPPELLEYVETKGEE